MRTVERVARDARLTTAIDGSGRPRLVPQASGIDAALGGIVAVVYDAMVDGGRSRLKACRRDVCHWIYYDRSKNHSSTWCAMSVCGNRTKVRAYRERIRPDRVIR